MPRRKKESQEEDQNGLSEFQKHQNQLVYNAVMRDLEKANERYEKAEQEKKQVSEALKRKEMQFEYDLAKKFGYRPLTELKKIDRDEIFKTRDLAGAENVFAQFDMARCYEVPIFLKIQNYPIAANWYRRIVKNYVPAQYNLAHHYLNNPIVYGQNNEKGAFDLLHSAAHAGHALAQHDLAICYLRNIGIEHRVENVVFAYFWFKAALTEGYDKAKIGLDKCLLLFKAYEIVFDDLAFSTPEQLWDNIQEKNVAKNAKFNHKPPVFFKDNIKIFKKYQAIALAHENSDKHAREKFHYAQCFKAGYHVGKSSGEYLRWLKKSADLEFAPAQHELATLFYERRIRAQNSDVPVANSDSLAFQWFEKAAKAGYPPAQYNLACLYKKRVGVAEHQNNDVIAFTWCMKAAIQGNPTAIALIKSALKNFSIGTPNVYKRNKVSSIVFSRNIPQYEVPVAVPVVVVETPTAAAGSGEGIKHSLSYRKQLTAAKEKFVAEKFAAEAAAAPAAATAVAPKALLVSSSNSKQFVAGVKSSATGAASNGTGSPQAATSPPNRKQFVASRKFTVASAAVKLSATGVAENGFGTPPVILASPTNKQQLEDEEIYKKTSQNMARKSSTDSVQIVAEPKRKFDAGVGKDKVCESAIERVLYAKHQAMRAQGISISNAKNKKLRQEPPNKRVRFE